MQSKRCLTPLQCYLKGVYEIKKEKHLIASSLLNWNTALLILSTFVERFVFISMTFSSQMSLKLDLFENSKVWECFKADHFCCFCQNFRDVFNLNFYLLNPIISIFKSDLKLDHLRKNWSDFRKNKILQNFKQYFLPAVSWLQVTVIHFIALHFYEGNEMWNQ